MYYSINLFVCRKTTHLPSDSQNNSFLWYSLPFIPHTATVFSSNFSATWTVFDLNTILSPPLCPLHLRFWCILESTEMLFVRHLFWVHIQSHCKINPLLHCWEFETIFEVKCTWSFVSFESLGVLVKLVFAWWLLFRWPVLVRISFHCCSCVDPILNVNAGTAILHRRLWTSFNFLNSFLYTSFT